MERACFVERLQIIIIINYVHINSLRSHLKVIEFMKRLIDYLNNENFNITVVTIYPRDTKYTNIFKFVEFLSFKKVVAKSGY